MNIKDQVIEKIQDFERLCHCKIADMSPPMRANLRIQLGADTEAQAIKENDHTFFQMDFTEQQITGGGIKVEIIPHLGTAIRVGIFV